MGTIGYAVRSADGVTRYGAFADAKNVGLDVLAIRDVSLDLRVLDVTSYRQLGSGLHVRLVDGKAPVLEGFFAGTSTADKHLFLSDGDGGVLVASYAMIGVGGTSSRPDDRVLCDVGQADPEVVPLVAPLQGGPGATAEDRIAIGGAGEAGATVVIEFQGVRRSVVVDGTGHWSATFDVASVASGSYDTTITATTTDAAGNSFATSKTIHIDTGPTLEPHDPIAGDNIPDAAYLQSDVTLYGTAEAGSSVQVTVGGVTRNSTVDANGNWTAVFAAGSLTPGEFETAATVVSTDAAGNWSVDFTDADIPVGEDYIEILATTMDPAGNVSTVSDTVRADTLESNALTS